MKTLPILQDHAPVPIGLIAAGPLYVDIRTFAVAPPAPAFHTVATPEAKNGDIRRLGGSAWQLAKFWQKHFSHSEKDSVTFCARVPKYDARIDCAQPFRNDAQWLVKRVEGVAATSTNFQPCLLPAAGVACCDYTLHIPTSDLAGNAMGQEPLTVAHQLWPIMTLAGGAAQQLVWDDILRTWSEFWRKNSDRKMMAILYLGGIDRTGIIPTLASSLAKNDPQTLQLFQHARVIIDCGRMDLRQAGPQHLRDLLTCFGAAHTAFLDTVSAEILHLPALDFLPKDYLVLRPHGVLPGLWRFFRKHNHNGKGVRIEWQDFDTAGLNKWAPGISRTLLPRPESVAVLVHELYRGGREAASFLKAGWQPFFLSGIGSQDSVTLSPDLFTTHPGFLRNLAKLRARLADPSTHLLLIHGETGAGKEIVARWLRDVHPTREKEVLVPVACGRLAGELVDSELFGYVKGAFTGAETNRTGAFEAANGGFLLVDDLDALPLATQAKLLRVLETHEVQPVGSVGRRNPVDVFTIFTVNQPPEVLVREGRLREDLYFRLIRGGKVWVPPLRERRDDAIRVAQAQWHQWNLSSGCKLGWPVSLEEALRKSPLKGNFRALQAAVQLVHEEARFAWLADQSTEPMLPEEVRRLLELDNQADEIQTRPKVRQFTKWISETRREPINCPGELDKGIFDKFLEAWNCWHKDGGSEYLTTKEIQMLLANPQLALLRRLLRASDAGNQLPRIVRLDKGRGFKWRLVTKQ